jgi:hypothetical protein
MPDGLYRKYGYHSTPTKTKTCAWQHSWKDKNALLSMPDRQCSWGNKKEINRPEMGLKFK